MSSRPGLIWPSLTRVSWRMELQWKELAALRLELERSLLLGWKTDDGSRTGRGREHLDWLVWTSLLG